MKMYSEADVDATCLADRQVTILGYGSQGRAHALNLKDSGFNVVMGLRRDGASWKQAQADGLTVMEPAEAVRDANDLTNELLTANAKNLREANAVVRTEMERGVFDIEAVRQANDDLVATINESLQIADEGKARRAEAEKELEKMERELRETLASAKARGDGTGDNAGTAVPAT